MKIIIHRGAQEIGGTCLEVISDNGSRIIVDLGMPLVDSKGNRFNFKEYSNLSGKALVKKKILPDLKGIYSWDSHSQKIDGILITHSHQDHYGLTDFIDEKVTYFLGEATHKLIDLTRKFIRNKSKIIKFKHIKSGKIFKCGDFICTPFLMDHSAYDAYSFLIEADGQKIIYTGDFRDHGRKENAFRYFLKTAPKNVDALFMEGSMFGRDDSKLNLLKTEKDVEKISSDLLSKSKGLTCINCSSQNIDRIVSFYRAAKRNQKLFLIDLYTAYVLTTLNKLNSKIPCPSKSFPEIKVFYPYYVKMDHIDQDFPVKMTEFRITEKDISENASNCVMLVRPPHEDFINRIHNLKAGDLIYSQWEGYLKESYTKNFIQALKRKGFRYNYIHISGHAYVDTLKKVSNTLKPRKIIPIHTFYPKNYIKHLNNVFILNDKTILNLTKEEDMTNYTSTFTKKLEKSYKEACNKNKTNDGFIYCARSDGKITKRNLDFTSEYPFCTEQEKDKKKNNTIDEYRLQAYILSLTLNTKNHILPIEGKRWQFLDAERNFSRKFLKKKRGHRKLDILAYCLDTKSYIILELKIKRQITLPSRELKQYIELLKKEISGANKVYKKQVSKENIFGYIVIPEPEQEPPKKRRKLSTDYGIIEYSNWPSNKKKLKEGKVKFKVIKEI